MEEVPLAYLPGGPSRVRIKGNETMTLHLDEDLKVILSEGAMTFANLVDNPCTQWSPRSRSPRQWLGEENKERKGRTRGRRRKKDWANSDTLRRPRQGSSSSRQAWPAQVAGF